MTSNQPAVPNTMRDHWWWRPGWRQGRSFYTWHITFDGQAGLRELAEFYAPMLASLRMLDSVPVAWLHLTMQGIGFADEVNESDVKAIIRAARVRCAAVYPFTATVGPPCVDAETIQMRVQPIEPLIALRTCIRQAIADVWGQDCVPEPAEGWRPHISLAYSNAAGPVQPIIEALAVYPPQIAEIAIATVSLIELNRDRRLYEWKDVSVVPLRAGQSGPA